MKKGLEITIPLVLKQDRTDNDYYVTGPVTAPINIDLSKFAVFFFPADTEGRYGKLLLRPANPEIEGGGREGDGYGD